MTITTSLDSIAPGQSIRYGETLVSAAGAFELGFFNPGTSGRLYVGVWYKDSPSTVVWVANREAPLNNASGVLQVNDQGLLVLLDATKRTVWSSNTSSISKNPIAQLLDTGNLVVRNGHGNNMDNLLWQSFDYPCDTLLPGMKLGWNLVTGVEWFLSSWKSAEDPGHGDNTIKIDIQGYPQSFQLKGNTIKYRAGHWNGLTFTGYPFGRPNSIFNYEFVFNDKELYYEDELLNRSVFTRYVISNLGVGQRFVWTSQTSSWEVMSVAIADQCQNYAFCGTYSICNIFNIPVCACLKGFVPKHPEEWNVSYWSSGCIKRIPLECNNNDGFQKYTGLKLPDTSSSQYNKTMNLTECQKSCLLNCSCTAYASLDIRNGGSGCLLWFDGLLDIMQFAEGGQDLYIRVPASELHSKILFLKFFVLFLYCKFLRFLHIYQCEEWMSF
ncbi:G-type lectin S-receptor-like serine/threonine-protein kinase At4g27290 [Abrus precatorius]|uniref:G-type lectin S-receptor-like serine/threonine-protein kinase At4g27290 n=1 Tax=Abrus precatorius TaxID=3816 RepID=A0A8B8LG94_ABRPR|nr:G-type lectin S-receptor-like serine/threonine-protein kinase At4g27290 [Abrus precatorius]